MMGIMDLAGRKYYVDISESTYNDLMGIYAVTVQKFQNASMGVTNDRPEPEVPVGNDPTGTPEEIERMRKLLEADSGDVMKKLGFVSDEDMQIAVQTQPDPVEDLLAMASSEEEEYEDPGEESLKEEDVEGL